jgi:hypothetical protein
LDILFTILVYPKLVVPASLFAFMAKEKKAPKSSLPLVNAADVSASHEEEGKDDSDNEITPLHVSLAIVQALNMMSATDSDIQQCGNDEEALELLENLTKGSFLKLFFRSCLLLTCIPLQRVTSLVSCFRRSCHFATQLPRLPRLPSFRDTAHIRADYLHSRSVEAAQHRPRRPCGASDDVRGH